MRIFRRGSRRERGQGSLESVAVVTVAAILVAATTGVIIQASPTIRDEVSYRICQVVNVLGGGDCQPPGALRTAEDRVPEEPCLASSTKLSAQASASVVVTVQKGYSFLVEQMSDGTYKITRVDSLGVGAGIGPPGVDVSVTIDGKKYGVTAIAGAEAMLSGKMGETWYADDKDGADGVIKDIIANDIVDQVAPEPGWGPVHVPNPVNRTIKAIIGDPGDSDESFIEGGVGGSAEATLSGITATGDAKVEADAFLGGKKTPEGYTAYFKTSVSGEAYGAVIGDDATATAGAEVLSEVVFDKGGKPTAIRMTTGVTLDAEVSDGLEDDQKYTETKIEVPLTGDPTKDAKYYAALAGGPLGVKSLVDKARTDGYVTQAVYSQDPNTYGLDFDGDLFGAKFGGSVSADGTTRSLEDALYWDGSQMAERPDC